MLIIPPSKYRSRRRPATNTVVTLRPTLVAAQYDGDDDPKSIQLTFDIAIDVTHIVPSAISVLDGDLNGESYIGGGAVTLLNPMTVVISLTYVGPDTNDGTYLSASVGNGIVAAAGGGAWLGVISLSLPMP
jgi:hypothetical protein